MAVVPRRIDAPLWVVLLWAFGVYVGSVPFTPYLLDSAELAAAAFSLGVAHPPGEPLALLVGRAAALLPMGSVALRVGLAQALCAIVAALLVWGMVGVLAGARALGEPPLAGPTWSRIERATAWIAIWFFAFAPGVVAMASRPEVYALQTALSLGAVYLALRGRRADDARYFAGASLLVGLGAANHPLVAGLCGLAVLAAVTPLARRRPGVVPLAALAALVGFAVVVYLPARAMTIAADPARHADVIAWGDARTPAGLAWLLSAKTFVQKSAVVHGAADPSALPFLFMEEIGLGATLLAPVGLLVLLRRRATRIDGGVIGIAALGSVIAALIGGIDPSNPDIRGYLAPALACAVVLAAHGLREILASLPLRARLPIAVLALVGALVPRAVAHAGHRGLGQARAADRAAAELLDKLPSRAAIFTGHHETAFLLAYHRAVEGRRADALHAHLGFVRGPGYVERLQLAEPMLAEPLNEYRAGRPIMDGLPELDRRHPVRVEPTEFLPPSLRAQLVPAPSLFALRDSRSAPATPVLPAKPPDAWRFEALGDRQVRGYLAFRAYREAELACENRLAAYARARLAELATLVPRDTRAAELRARCGAP